MPNGEYNRTTGPLPVRPCPRALRVGLYCLFVILGYAVVRACQTYVLPPTVGATSMEEPR